MTTPLQLIGCGILQKEITHLITRNHWPLECLFLDSALHNHLDQLSNQLESALQASQAKGRQAIVFYGCCHPLMEDILERNHSMRTPGQNCIAMLLGYSRFMEELEKGAYFLLEEWALTWEPMLTRSFGSNLPLIQEIFHSSHKHMIALRTPCSHDFTQAAQAAARFVDLPLLWMDTPLDHLEAALAETIARQQEINHHV